jgi:hypothetical protein
MKPRNARFLDDLLAGAHGDELYKHIRDGHWDDIAELLAGLERRLPSEQAIRGLVKLANLMLEARGVRGSDAARKRDMTVARLRAWTAWDDRHGQ